jgi:hypothetical protein
MPSSEALRPSRSEWNGKARTGLYQGATQWPMQMTGQNGGLKVCHSLDQVVELLLKRDCKRFGSTPDHGGCIDDQ